MRACNKQKEAKKLYAQTSVLVQPTASALYLALYTLPVECFDTPTRGHFGRYIPREPLSLVQFSSQSNHSETAWCWRVRPDGCEWSAPRTFSVVPMATNLRIPLGASWSDIQAVFDRALSVTTPGGVRVSFEPGQRTLTPPPATPKQRPDPSAPNGGHPAAGGDSPVFISFVGASDVHVDGGGSTVVLTAPVT